MSIDYIWDQIQKGIIDKIKHKITDLNIVNDLYKRIRNRFGKMNKEFIKIDQLWLLEQGSKICDRYIQIFKKTTRKNSYSKRLLIGGFKWGLQEAIRPKFGESPNVGRNFHGVARKFSKDV